MSSVHDIFEDSYNRGHMSDEHWHLVKCIRKLEKQATKSLGITKCVHSHLDNFGMPKGLSTTDHTNPLAERRWRDFNQFVRLYSDHGLLDKQIIACLFEHMNDPDKSLQKPQILDDLIQNTLIVLEAIYKKIFGRKH